MRLYSLHELDTSLDYVLPRRFYESRPRPSLDISYPEYVFAVEKDPSLLFLDIHKLVLFLTPYCNFGCMHCCVDYAQFGQPFPVMTRDAALSLVDMIEKPEQYTNSGGEVWLLDKSVRERAVKQGLLPESYLYTLEGVDFLEDLVRAQAQKLLTFTPLVEKEVPLRIPTNGSLLPPGEENLLGLLSRYYGAGIVMSIGPFQQIEYMKRGLSMEQRIKELISVRKQLNQAPRTGRLSTLDLGFMYTYLNPRGMSWKELDTWVAERNKGLNVPTQNPDENPILQLVEGMNWEPQRVIAWGRAKNMPCALPPPRIPPTELAETDEFYAVAWQDGNTVLFFDNTLDMYSPRPKNALFALRFE